METLQTIETKIDKLIEQNKKAIETLRRNWLKQTKLFQTLKPNLYRLKKEINSEKYVEAKGDLMDGRTYKRIS